MPYLQATARTSAPARDDLPGAFVRLATPRLTARGPAALPRLACLMWFRGSDMVRLARAGLAAFCWLGARSGPLDTGSFAPQNRRSWRGPARAFSGLLRFLQEPGRLPGDLDQNVHPRPSTRT